MLDYSDEIRMRQIESPPDVLNQPNRLVGRSEDVALYSSNSLQLDETVAVYSSRLLGDASYVGLVNNKHPLVPLSTLQAGYRLLIHALAAESLHAQLVQLKRAAVRAHLAPA